MFHLVETNCFKTVLPTTLSTQSRLKYRILKYSQIWNTVNYKILLWYKTCRGIGFKHTQEKLKIKDNETKCLFELCLRGIKLLVSVRFI